MQPADLDHVLAIAAASPEAPQWPEAAYARYLAPDHDNRALLRAGLVAGSQGPNPQSGDILAFASATLLLDGQENRAQLDSMAVRPEVRRHGIGAALLRALLAWAAQNGARHFSLEVRASNVPAIGLYQRFGFRQEGRRPGYYADPREDALLLGTAVTAGTDSATFPL